jgi:rubredoxin
MINYSPTLKTPSSGDECNENQILCSYMYRETNYFTSKNQITVQTKFEVVQETRKTVSCKTKIAKIVKTAIHQFTTNIWQKLAYADHLYNQKTLQ